MREDGEVAHATEGSRGSLLSNLTCLSEENIELQRGADNMRLKDDVNSGMAMANQPTPPLGASAEGVGGGRCLRVLFNSPDWPKQNYLLNSRIFFYFNSFICTCRHQKDGITPSPLHN